ncbi:hypothetical protein EVAR_24981_1 [Eumeta japonica]|uniref:Uncharacterized protein n=1 Tax=Eumeta variegata TaxID=151549 RepID=A0A4C1XG63_EUMVA|nr:hypothetical protein EVAR_24981_1 [Eumeta japonica]
MQCCGRTSGISLLIQYDWPVKVRERRDTVAPISTRRSTTAASHEFVYGPAQVNRNGGRASPGVNGRRGGRVRAPLTFGATAHSPACENRI